MRADSGFLDEEELKRRYRDNEYADIAGEEPPWPELRHEHIWDPETDYCTICGADGRA